MEAIIALILGIIQGITEWLPISSEGILVLIMVNFFKSTLLEAVFLAIWTHIGTLLAAIVFFRKDLDSLVRRIFLYLKDTKKTSFDKQGSFLVLSTGLTALVGTPLLFFGLDKINLPSYWVTILIGLLLIITGIIQLLSRRRRSASNKLQVKDAIPVGIVQGFSILPGISRSGITVSTLLLLGYSGKNALRLSFLMSIPVVLGAEVGLVLLNRVVFNINAIILVGAAFLTGLATIKIFLTAAEKMGFGYFCILIGSLSCLTFFL
jgi:undecaprenyl-diphosphatase